MSDETPKGKSALREEEILKFWQQEKIFEQSLQKESPKGDFIFYEGPPTANGKPGIHHLESRAFKDIIPRYKTMQGFRVPRSAGWDTHGLPVELQMEKKLGLKSKKEIEAYGIEAFNKACKESVLEYIGEWEKFTDRIGYWVDKNSAYYTFDNSYIEKVWNVIKHVDEKKLLYKDFKVVPWCPRCGTALSSHELGQPGAYQDDKDLSVTAKFKIKQFPGAYFLAWTTTPWTLPGNVALAVGKDIIYVEAKVGDEVLVLAKDRLSSIEGDYEILAEHTGSEMVGMEYEPLYPYLKDKFGEKDPAAFEKAYKVYAADFVNTDEGTGIVHTAVMYGADDFALGTQIGLPKFHLVDDTGHFVAGLDNLSGRFVKDEDVAVDIIKDLAHRGLLFKKEKITHSYPHCWRCNTPLIYYARDSWYISMSKLRDKLVAENEKINWHPEYIKEGRFGEWIRDAKDWAISRERYWGTPLPVWYDEEGNYRVIGSVEDLKKFAKHPEQIDTLDLHRPFIDEVELVDEQGRKLTRAKEVMDVWLDSGSMPFASGEDDTQGNPRYYPADFISEAIDQTRGWFYTLHAVGILMDKGAAYKNVICLGHILDAAGQKMSKSKGNVVDPWMAMDKVGADALRLWMYTVNQPGDSKNFDEQTVDEVVKKVFNPLENILSFYNLYKDETMADDRSDHVLDRWIIARLHELLHKGTDHLEHYEVFEAGRLIRDFINDFSTWYIRRSRERFKSDDMQERRNALATTRYVLFNLSKYLAPFAPFFAEYMYREVKAETDPQSVHLTRWPQTAKVDEKVLTDMQRTREAVSEALEARNQLGIKIRQPLASVVLRGETLADEYLELIKDEVNVKAVFFDSTLDHAKLDTDITPELLNEGLVRDFIRALQDTRKEAGVNQNDEVTLLVQTDEAGKDFIEKNKIDITKPTRVREVKFEDVEGKEITVGEMKFILKI